jgi:hypothetical protein
MQHDSRVPVAEEYVRALGRAAYNFSYLEWGIVWLAETIRPGFLARVSGMTAGTIGREFEALTGSRAEGDAKALQDLAVEFLELVKDRNAMLHGVPYTASGGEQRLLHLGPNGRRDWTEALILEAAKKFELAEIEANILLHAGRYEAYMAATGKSLSV